LVHHLGQPLEVIFVMQCHKTHILSLDLYLSSPLEIALHWVKFRFASNRWPVALDSQQLLHLVELRLVGSFHSNRTSLYFLKLIFKVIFYQQILIHESRGLQSSSNCRSRKLGGVFSQITGLQLNAFRAQRCVVALPIHLT
jgi:hypothetical protein